MSKVIDVILQLKDNMTGPMSRATSKLKENASQYQRLGRSIQRTGRQISSAGSTLTKTITAPVVALGAVAFKEYGEYDKQMRLVQQTMGSTAEESKMLGDAVKESAKNSVFGMQDMADAALNYARAGYNAKEAADMLTPAASLAAGTGTELKDVTAGLAGAIKGFGANTDEATKYADVFQKAQAQAMTTTQDLFNAMSKAAPIFSSAGWNIRDLAAATGVLGDANIEGSEAGTALKTGIARLSAPAKEGAKWIERLGINITNADGTYKSFADVQYILHDSFEKLTKVEKTQAASAIFGKNQMAKWLALIKRSPDDVSAMIGALDDASGEAKNAADALMSGPGGAIEKLKSNWDVFKKTLGETLAPVLTPLVEKLTEMLQKFSNLSDEQKKNIVKWVAIAAAVGPCLIAFGKVVSGVGSVIKIFGSLGKAIKGGSGIFKLFAGAPKGAMLGALGAIGIAIGVVVRNWDKISAKVSAFYNKCKPWLDKIGKAFSKVFGFIEKVIDTIAMPALDSILGALEGLTQSLSGVIDFLEGVFTGDWEKAWNGLKDIAMGAVNAIDKALDGLFSKHMSNLLDLFGIGLSDKSVEKNQKLRRYFYDNDLMNKGYVLKSNSQGKVYIADKRGDDIPLGFEDELAKLASGTSNWKGGPVHVSEKGGEIIDLPSGSRVYPHDESVQKAYKDGLAQTQANNINIKIPKIADQIIVREDADIDRIATKLAHKLEKVSQNVGGSRIGYQFQS